MSRSPAAGSDGDRFDRITIVVFTEANTTGIYEDDMVALWGRPIDTFTGRNAFGASITQPLFRGDYIEKLE